jgi:hypothetical protein
MHMSFDLEKILKALEWVLSRATVLTGAFVALGALGWVVTTVLQLPFFHVLDTSHDILDKLGLRVLIFWLVLALVTVIVQLKKNAKQSASIAAEAIRLNPAIDDASVVPAVQTEIVKQLTEVK